MTSEPTVVTRPAQPYVGITCHVTMQSMATVADRMPEVFGWLAVRGVEPAGAPFFRFHTIDMEKELEVEAGVPVPSGSAVPASDEAVTAGFLPAGRYATVTHVGHPDELMQVTADLLAWAGREGLTFDQKPGEPGGRGEKWGSRLEFYETNPAEEPDMNKWQTTLAFRLAD